MKKGTKVRLTKPVKSSWSNKMLPSEGTLVDVQDNFGRKIFLVLFDGESFCQYLFESELEVVDESDV